MSEIKKIGLLAVREDLKNGLTRWKKDDLGFGNIEEKYSLTFSEMKILIQHPKMRGIKTKVPSIILIDDIPEEIVETETTTNVEVGEPRIKQKEEKAFI